MFLLGLFKTGTEVFIVDTLAVKHTSFCVVIVTKQKIIFIMCVRNELIILKSKNKYQYLANKSKYIYINI